MTPARGKSKPRAGPSNRSKSFSFTYLDRLRGRNTLRCSSRTAGQSRSGRWCIHPCVLRHPFVNLTAGWAPHRNRDARKAFEQHPLALQTSCDWRTSTGALDEDISQRRTPFGNGLEDQPGRQARICARASALQRIVRAGACRARRYVCCVTFLTDSILWRQKSPAKIPSQWITRANVERRRTGRPNRSIATGLCRARRPKISNRNCHRADIETS